MISQEAGWKNLESKEGERKKVTPGAFKRKGGIWDGRRIEFVSGEGKGKGDIW